MPDQIRSYVHEFYLELYLREVLQLAGASKGSLLPPVTLPECQRGQFKTQLGKDAKFHP